MTRRRVARLNEQFRRELMQLIRYELRDPRIGDVTVTRVHTSPDLYQARVFLTTLAPEVDRPAILEGLNAARPFLRGELGRRLHVRRAPELDFEWDRGLDHARRIDELLAEVRSPEEQQDGPPDAGTPDD